MRRRLPDRQEQAQAVQPVPGPRPIGHPGPAAHQPRLGELEGQIQRELRRRVLRLDDQGVGADLGQTRAEWGVADQPRTGRGESRAGRPVLVGAGQARTAAPVCARFGDDRVPELRRFGGGATRPVRDHRGQRPGGGRTGELPKIRTPVQHPRRAGRGQRQQQAHPARTQVQPGCGGWCERLRLGSGQGRHGLLFLHQTPPRSAMYDSKSCLATTYSSPAVRGSRSWPI